MSSVRKSGSARAGTGSASSRRSKSPDENSGADTPSLRRAVQSRLLTDVFQACSGKSLEYAKCNDVSHKLAHTRPIRSDKLPGWKILIVDDHSMKIISSVVGMYDIMERKVTLVESLEKKRAPFHDQGAIYLLTPNEESVETLLEDFSSSPPLYGGAVFLFFLSRLPDSLLQRIKACRPLLKRVKCLQEINIDFLAKEERAFSLDMRDTFQSFYLRRGTSPLELKLAEKLVTVCATLNEYPHIRYKQSSAICTSLSNIFHLKMDEFVAQNSSWWYHGGPMKNQAAKRDRATLLLLDRADDALTPLLHDFNYQPMVHDLLTMDGDRITYSADAEDGPKAKDVLLDEKDSVWVELRGKHIAGVIETLSDRIREIMNSSTGSSLGKKNQGNMTLSQMATAMKALPEYQEVMSKLSQHMHLAHECMSAFRTQNLIEVSELEQTAATGKSDEGRTPKMADIVDSAERFMMSMKNVQDRLRLLLVLTISQGGLRQQDRRRLMNVAELSRQDIKTLNSLEVLGLATLSSSEKKTLA
jgi:syntaxin-binding protein 1